MPAHPQRLLYVFPGQGSQYQGMGSDLYQAYAAARKVYDTASEVLGYDMIELSFNGPEQQLNLTRFTQPALLTHSIACLEVFKELASHSIAPTLAAGHSLGEYSALVAAGSLRFVDALQLVQQRGEYMGAYGKGEMLAFPLDVNTVRAFAEQHYCAIAACNLAEQTVVGGLDEDLDLVTQALAEQFPRKRAVRLKTEGAFHTYFMIEAAQHYRPVLEAADLSAPHLNVLSNYTGSYHDHDPARIKSRLFFQLFHPVLWINNLQTALEDGVTVVIEFGGGIGAGATPDAKRPNLESIIKKAAQGVGREVLYLPAINAPTLQATAERLAKS